MHREMTGQQYTVYSHCTTYQLQHISCIFETNKDVSSLSQMRPRSQPGFSRSFTRQTKADLLLFLTNQNSEFKGLSHQSLGPISYKKNWRYLYPCSKSPSKSPSESPQSPLKVPSEVPLKVPLEVATQDPRVSLLGLLSKPNKA